jgi:hypothetical protein
MPSAADPVHEAPAADLSSWRFADDIARIFNVYGLCVDRRQLARKAAIITLRLLSSR